MRSNLSPTYTAIKQLRSIGDCATALAKLRAQLPSSDDDALEAVVCLFVCGDIASAAHVARTHRWKKEWAVQIAGAFAEAFGNGDLSRSLAMARKAIAVPAAPYDASALYLLLLQRADLIEEADAYIRNRLQKAPAGEVFLLAMVAEAAVAAGNWREAYRAACGVLASDPDDYRALIALGIVNYEIGNINESLGNAIRANATRKGSLPAILQIMRCRNKLGNYYAAVAAFDTLSESGPPDPAVHIELGRAYQGLGEHDRAIAAYRAVLAAGARSIEALRPLIMIYACSADMAAIKALVETYPDEIKRDLSCMNWLGLGALNRGDVDEASRLFSNAFAIAKDKGDALRDLPWPVPEPRLRHDCEQLELLARRGRLDSAGRDALPVLRRYCAQNTGVDSSFAPVGAEANTLKSALCTTFHVPDVPFAGSALGKNDYAKIEETFMADRVVVIDNFLSEEALRALRSYCEEATVWKVSYERGYVGAVLAEGFSPTVLLVIAQALKNAMPRVIADHLLTQAWAFKYDQRLQGINMHADFAEVNVNFWITPDEACEDPTSGGMIVYDVPVPKSWTFYEYNNESEKLAVYVKVHKANARRVPYRANRCVLFDSSLIHVTDELHFKPGYENRRVNVTLLYGRPRNTE